MKHKWKASYPRGTWPVFTCDRCGRVRVPTAQELRIDPPGPAWFTETTCKEPEPMSRDDIEWLTGTGRYGQ